MALFCDVALPVPLDRLFTYSVGETVPAPGARVLVPFGGQRLMGVVLRVHEEVPAEEIEVRPVQSVLDGEALLTESLLRLARWIASYYLAPIGEVLRSMLPLAAEVRRRWLYRLAEQGRRVLYEGAERGASRRSRLSADDQAVEYRVLNVLEGSDRAMTGSALRSAAGARKALLEGMVRKRWLSREAEAAERDARRLRRVLVLVEEARLPRLSAGQTMVLAEMAAAGGRLSESELRERLLRAGAGVAGVRSLLRRGLLRLEHEESSFHLGGVHEPGKKLAHEHLLNEEQTEALASIVTAMDGAAFTPLLLFGVTGSGKTAVYVAAMQRALAAGRTAMLLVPEIGLTPAMAAQMYAAFGTEVALLHSALTADERAQQWHRIRTGAARVVVGTRSAVFAPAQRLGLLIVDEEHDASYKQEETPRYHARDVAVMRAKLEGAVVVLGSATPSLETWWNAERGRYQRLEMAERVGGRPLPVVELVDMRAEFRAVSKEELFSRQLRVETQTALERGEQVIILLNRRGYSFSVLCRSCGARIDCENCAIAMTLHKPLQHAIPAEPGERLVCHYCGWRRSVPARCPACQSEHLYLLGAGSQQGEERLIELFPGARIGRMDRDTVRGRADMERLLTRMHSGEVNLLVGTQMIAKGHDLHGVTLVGVVGADASLGLPDFRAAERVFQLLTQVAGRAGRGNRPGRVLVQTFHTEHYAVQAAQRHDYRMFAMRELRFRRLMHYPPFTALANVLVASEQLEEAAGWAAAMGRWFGEHRPESVRVLGPAAAPIARLKRVYRFHFLLKSESRGELREVLRRMLEGAEAQGVPRRAVTVDVDPVRLL